VAAVANGEEDEDEDDDDDDDDDEDEDDEDDEEVAAPVARAPKRKAVEMKAKGVVRAPSLRAPPRGLDLTRAGVASARGGEGARQAGDEDEEDDEEDEEEDDLEGTRSREGAFSRRRGPLTGAVALPAEGDGFAEIDKSNIVTSKRQRKPVQSYAEEDEDEDDDDEDD